MYTNRHEDYFFQKKIYTCHLCPVFNAQKTIQKKKRYEKRLVQNMNYYLINATFRTITL